MKPGKAVHPSNGNGTAPDGSSTPAGIEISFDRGANRNRQSTGQVKVTNAEASGGNLLEVSFNNGREWFAIATDTTMDFDIMCHRCRLRGNGGTAAYSIVGLVY